MLLGRLLRVDRPNKVGGSQMSVRLSTKCSFDFSEIWYIGRGRRVMHDCMHYAV